MMKYPHTVPVMLRRLCHLRRPSALKAASHPEHQDLLARLAAVSSLARLTLIPNLFSSPLLRLLRSQNHPFTLALSPFQRFFMRLANSPRHSLTMTRRLNTVHMHTAVGRLRPLRPCSLAHTLCHLPIMTSMHQETRIPLSQRSRTPRLQIIGL